MSERARTPNRETAAFIDSTLDEHKGCLECVAHVEACLDRHPEDRGRWIEELLDSLKSLGLTLKKHFESEEAGPLFRKLPLQHPRLARRLTALEEEHGQMLEQIDELLDSAAMLKHSDTQLHELRTLNAGVQLAVARVRRHEAAENELMLEANWDEVGVGD